MYTCYFLQILNFRVTLFGSKNNMCICIVLIKNIYVRYIISSKNISQFLFFDVYFYKKQYIYIVHFIKKHICQICYFNEKHVSIFFCNVYFDKKQYIVYVVLIQIHICFICLTYEITI